jgi:hypothetical protein
MQRRPRNTFLLMSALVLRIRQFDNNHVKA